MVYIQRTIPLPKKFLHEFGMSSAEVPTKLIRKRNPGKRDFMWASLTLKVMIDEALDLSDYQNVSMYEFLLSCYLSSSNKNIKCHEYVCEKDSDGKVHLHALLKMSYIYCDWNGQPWKDRYKAFNRFPFLHAKIDEAKTPTSWQLYMMKDYGKPDKFHYMGRSRPARMARENYDYGRDAYKEILDMHEANLKNQVDLLMLDLESNIVFHPM